MELSIIVNYIIGGIQMNPFEVIGGVLLLISGILIILVVMLQESKQANGMNAVTGGSSENYIGRNGGKTKDAFLAKLTRILAIVVFILAIAMNLLVRYL